MKKVISWLKSSRIAKVLTAGLVGILLIVNTACAPVQAKTADKVREEVPSKAITSEYKGGMNSYSDVDPRFDDSAAKAKAKGLVDKTERQVIDMTDDVNTNTKRIIDKKGENVEHFNQNVKGNVDALGEKTKNSAKDFAEGTRKGSKNIKENASNAGEDVNYKSQEKGNDFLGGVKQAIDKATNAVD